jgi:hypothetical protein
MSAQIIKLPTQRNPNPHADAPEVVALRKDIRSAARVARLTRVVADLEARGDTTVTAFRAPAKPRQSSGLTKAQRLEAIRLLQRCAADMAGRTITAVGGVLMTGDIKKARQALFDIETAAAILKRLATYSLQNTPTPDLAPDLNLLGRLIERTAEDIDEVLS